MRRAASAGILLLAVFTRSATAQDVDRQPRAIVRAAERAVSDDSAESLASRWRAALAHDSSDRAALLGLATLANLQYDFPTSERLLSKLLGQTGASPDRWTVQALLGFYNLANAQGDYRKADSLLRPTIATARRIRDRGGQMDAMAGFVNTRGAISGAAARSAALDSLASLLPTGDSPERAGYLCRRGHLQAALGDSAALPVLRQGLAMAERLGDRRLAGNCLDSYAVSHSFLGRIDSVLPLMDRAESLLRATHDHASLGRLYSRRSDELQSAGRLGEAKQAVLQVLSEAALSRNRERYAFAYGGLGGLALLIGDLPGAIDYFGRAFALYDSLGQAIGAKIARRSQVWVLSAAEDVARPRGLEKEARSTLGYDHGRLALAQGDLDVSERYFTEYLAGIPADNRLHRNLIRVRLAQVWVRRANLERAEREITEASQELETWRASLGDDDLRRYAFAATALGELYPQGPVAQVLGALVHGGRVDAAFALGEQRRARALADRLNQADALREGGVPSGAPAHRAQAATAPEIAGALPDDSTALLEYVAGTEGAPTTLFMVTRSGVRARLLQSADTLAPVIARMVALLEAGENAEGPARTLGQALLVPARQELPHSVRRLVIVPDGPIHRVPFDALRLQDDTPAAQQWAIGLAPSAAVAAKLWREQPRSADTASGGVRILALGDPAFKDEKTMARSSESETYRSAFNATGGLPRLIGSGTEAREVARFAPGGGEVRLRDQASEQWFKRAPLDRFAVIHLATHALVDESSLARTALALAPGPGEDGFLSPADLASLHLKADLVVLSACRTAGGVPVVGEGIEGLTTPLLAAGARSVVATQWRIGDRSTVRLVRDFYEQLAKGQPVAEALRSAKLAALRRGAPASEWAGLTVVGDPWARVAIKEPKPDWAWWAAASGGLTLLAVAGYWAMRVFIGRDRSLHSQ